MKRAKYLVLSLSIGLLASCASVPETDNNLPDSNIADNWRAPHQSSSLTSSSPKLSSTPQLGGQVLEGWLDALNITALSAFVRDVLKNNLDFRAAAYRMRAAGYNADISRGNLYPTLAANLGAGRTHGSNSFVTGNRLSLGLDASWELDVWGRLAAVSSASNADYAAAQYDLEGARLSLAAQVTQTWFDVTEAHLQVDLAIRTVESYQRAVGVVRDRFVRGLSTGLDLRLIMTELDASRATLSNRNDFLGQQKRRLEFLAGRYPAAKIIAGQAIPDLNGDVPVGLPVNLLERRPDLRAAKQRLLSAGYNSQAAEKNLLPSFSITASGNNSSSNFRDLLKFDNIFWNLLGNITQPIFQGGSLRYKAKAEQQLFEAEKQVYARNLLIAFREVEDALSSEKFLKEQVTYTARAAKNAASAQAVAIDQYARGLIKISVLLESQRQSLLQQSKLISIRKQRINNRIALYLALGGDFSVKSEHRTKEIEKLSKSAPIGNKIGPKDEGNTV